MTKYNGFTLNGYHSLRDMGIVMGTVIKPIAPSISPVMEDIPGAMGQYFEGYNVGTKQIQIPYFFISHENQDLVNKEIEKLAGILIPMTNKEVPLVFDDEPNKTWMVHVLEISNPTLPEQGSWDFDGTITLEASKPFAYLPREYVYTDKLPADGRVLLSVAGNTETPVDIQIIPKHSAKHVGVLLNGGTGVFALGEDRAELQDTIVAQWQEALSDTGDATSGSFTNWLRNPNTVSNLKWGQKLAPVMGGANKISASGMAIGVGTKTKTGYNPSKDKMGKTNKYTVLNYGTDSQEAKGTTGTPWYGPIMVTKGFDGGALDDFKVIFRLKHQKHKGAHNGRAMGDVEVLFLDPNGNAFFRAGIKDQAGGSVPVIYTQIGKPGTDWINGNYANIYVGKSFNVKNGENYKSRVYTGLKKSKRNVTLVKKVRGKKKKVTTQEPMTTYYFKMEQNNNNTSELTNTWIEWEVHKVGNRWSFWIYQLDAGGNRVKDSAKGKVHFKKTKYIDKGGNYSASLGSIAVGMFKHSIKEDTTNPPNIYRNVHPALTMLKAYRRNPAYDLKKKPLAYAVASGEVLDFDGENYKTTVNGTVVEEAWVTNYPKLQPGQNTLTFVSDADLSDAIVDIQYNPRVK